MIYYYAIYTLYGLFFILLIIRVRRSFKNRGGFLYEDYGPLPKHRNPQNTRRRRNESAELESWENYLRYMSKENSTTWKLDDTQD